HPAEEDPWREPVLDEFAVAREDQRRRRYSVSETLLGSYGLAVDRGGSRGIHTCRLDHRSPRVQLTLVLTLADPALKQRHSTALTSKCSRVSRAAVTPRAIGCLGTGSKLPSPGRV